MDRGSAAESAAWIGRRGAAGCIGSMSTGWKGSSHLSAAQLADFAAILEAGPDRERTAPGLPEAPNLEKANRQRHSASVTLLKDAMRGSCSGAPQTKRHRRTHHERGDYALEVKSRRFAGRTTKAPVSMLIYACEISEISTLIIVAFSLSVDNI
jgi:hypothetical protein